MCFEQGVCYYKLYVNKFLNAVIFSIEIESKVDLILPITFSCSLCCRWTREQAHAFMTENSNLHYDRRNKEIDRYVTWPGQVITLLYSFHCLFKLELI